MISGGVTLRGIRVLVQVSTQIEVYYMHNIASRLVSLLLSCSCLSTQFQVASVQRAS